MIARCNALRVRRRLGAGVAAALVLGVSAAGPGIEPDDGNDGNKDGADLETDCVEDEDVARGDDDARPCVMMGASLGANKA